MNRLHTPDAETDAYFAERGFKVEYVISSHTDGYVRRDKAPYGIGGGQQRVQTKEMWCVEPVRGLGWRASRWEPAVSHWVGPICDDPITAFVQAEMAMWGRS